MKIYRNIFEKMISLENLFDAWANFRHDKRNRVDVQEFEVRLEENVFKLHRELKEGSYKHGLYKPFYIHDPKQRLIHKAGVRDRIVHHAIYSVLSPIFEATFIANSFSCRIGKGIHKGVKTLEKILRKVGRNNTRSCFALKCDIKKFFDSIDHKILLTILAKRIRDGKAMSLLAEIVSSFSAGTKQDKEETRDGLPIGNLTSQIFANIYLNELDQFVKHKLHIKHYVRYTDDFVIVSESEIFLRRLIKPIGKFLDSQLRLSLHPKKITLRKYKQGVDFLGYILLPHYRVVRTRTKRRMIRNLRKRFGEYKNGLIAKETLEQCLASYLGVLSHANCYKLSKNLINLISW